MNKERRKRLTSIAEQISVLIDEAQEICEEEQDAFNNMPEGLQQGERGQLMEQAVTTIETAVEGLEQAKYAIEEITNE